MGQQKEEDKQLQQDAKTYDFLAKQGYIDAADLMGMSPREKSQQVRGLMDATRIGSQIQQMDYQKLMGQNLENQMNAPPWQPSGVDLNGDGTPDMLMTSPSSAVPVPSDSQAAGPLTQYQGPRVKFSDGSIGTWNGKRYTVSPPRLTTTTEYNEQGLPITVQRPEDVSGLPDYSVQDLMGGAGAAAPADPAGVDVTMQDKPAGEHNQADIDAVLRANPDKDVEWAKRYLKHLGR